MKARKNSPGIVVGRLVAVLVLAVGAPCALGQVAQVREQRGVQEAVARLKAEAPQAIVFQEGPRITRVAGQPLGFGTTPAESAAAFVQAHSTVFGLSPEELSPGSTVDGAYARPLMYEPETGTYKFTLVYYSQYRDSLPVYRADLRVLVRNEDGYPVVWAGSSLRNLGGFTMPAGAGRNIAEDEAHAAAARVIPGLVNFGPSDLVIWAGVDDTEVSPAVAIAFVADNGRPATAQYEKWLFVADAATGAVLYREDRIIHTDVVGSVHGMATTIPKADFCNPEVDTPMPWAKVTIGGTTVYADASGDFTIPNGGSSPVTVTSYMGGQYFVVNDQGGPLENLSMTVTPPGPANFLHNAANTSEFVRAEVNGYVQANVVRNWVLWYLPDYPTISTQTGFPIYVNINDCCNAYYDGSSINFYRACGGCANTAYSNVVHHEYGHHLVECAGSGQEEYGEGMSDSVGMLIADDPVCGYGFEGDCNSGIRSGDNDLQYPCSGEIHYCGQLLSGCIWSTRNELAQTYPDEYLHILSDLTINSILLHTGYEITPQITIDFLTLDDDDGNLSNGTPHSPEICAGFGAHNMACPLPTPDLIVESSSVAPATNVSPGDAVVLTDVVKNQGDAPADAPFRVSWYISEDDEVTTDDLLWPAAWRYVAYLAPGETSGASYSVPWPDEYPYNCPGHTYYVAVMADDENDIFETNEGNNWGQAWTVTLAGTNEPPVLSNYDGWPDGVDPDQGYLETTFTFRVHYYDPEGTPPLVAHVVIDGQPYDMTGGGNDSDYEVALTGADLGIGTHDYHFYFQDGCFATGSLPGSGEWQLTVIPPCDPEELAEVASDGAPGASFGYSAALEGDTAVIGAYLDDPNGLVDAGSVYVFVRSAGTWTQQAKLTAADAAPGDNFGWSVAIDGDTLAIGAPGDDASRGSVYVFVRSGETWMPEAKLVPPNGAAGDRFGSELAIDAGTLVIGADYDDLPGKADAGSAYVFVRSGGAWTWQATLIAQDGAAGDHFGDALAIEGDTAFVGAWYDDTRTGAVYVFTRAAGQWTQQAKLRGNDSTPWGYFGTSIAVRQGTLIVGSDGQYVGSIRPGEAYVFRQHASVWEQEGGPLRADDGAQYDNFGRSVAIDGNVAIVGALEDDNAGGTDAGMVYVFVRRLDGEWIEVNKLTASDGEPYGYFGSSVALEGNTALIGARGKDLPGAADAGSAYVFDLGCIRLGDLNCDGAVDFGDINPFVLYLSNLSAWQVEYPDCPPENGDINGDGSYPSVADINPFVALLSAH
jgi:hypothetical protein